VQGGLGAAPRAQQQGCTNAKPTPFVQAARHRLVEGVERCVKAAAAPSSNQQQRSVLVLIDDVNHLASMRGVFYRLARDCEWVGGVVGWVGPR